MTTALYYLPIPMVDNARIADCKLRDIIIRRFGQNGIITLASSAYLNGLSDAEIPGANDLIEALKRWGSVKVFEE